MHNRVINTSCTSDDGLISSLKRTFHDNFRILNCVRVVIIDRFHPLLEMFVETINNLMVYKRARIPPASPSEDRSSQLQTFDFCRCLKYGCHWREFGRRDEVFHPCFDAWSLCWGKVGIINLKNYKMFSV